MSLSGRFRAYPRHTESRLEHVVSLVNCGNCHHPVLQHGWLLLFDKHLAIEVEGDGSFVLLTDPDQPDFDNLAVKYLRRGADDALELVSNVGVKRLTARHTVIGTLVCAYIPEPGATGEEDAALRAVAEQAMAQESARRDQVATDAVNRWGKPNGAARAEAKARS
jgi:hypothetical protein